MALVAERWGLIPELRGFAQQGKPIWGTCAGMIFLAERAQGAVRQCVAAGVCGPHNKSTQLLPMRAHNKSHASASASPALLHAGQKEGGQALLGGLDITVSRNFFGAQINSFETQLPADAHIQAFGG
jgi:5'-phosphate synthase pdxT subunit